MREKELSSDSISYGLTGRSRVLGGWWNKRVVVGSRVYYDIIVGSSMLGLTMNDKCSTWAISLAFYIKESQELRCLFNSYYIQVLS